MNKKNRGNLLEQHAEKIVLGVAGIVSLGLLWMFVLSSPNAVKVDGRKYGPGEIDRYVKSKADRLKAALAEPPKEGPDVSPNAMRNMYLAKQANTIADVPDFQVTLVKFNPDAAEEDRRYAVPQVGTVDQVAVEVIRGSAHVPMDEIGPDNAYDKAMTQLGDIDLVTVQASFDIGALNRSFTQSFIMGRGVRNEWKDEELAEPVFASAQLQRRRAVEGGGWSEWEVIPRSKIDMHRAMLSAPEKIDFDISVQKTRFKPFEIQRSVLQPKPYNFASDNVVWLAPSFHKEYVKIAEREKKEAKRQERERGRDERSRDRRPPGYGGAPGRSRTAQGGANAGMYGEDARTARSRTRQPVRGQRPNDPRRSRDMIGPRGNYAEGNEFGYGADYQRRQPQAGTLDNVIAENRKVMIYTEQQLRDMKEPLVFWAHDDTIEPGNIYQYKIRLGVFNPIAGKNWFSPQEEQYKDHVVLWSEFSQLDEDVEIPPMIYFFPTGIARTADKKVAIDVFKYYSGNWRSEAFDVHPGEMIGKLVDSKESSPAASARDDYGEYDEYAAGIMANTMPKTIDFDTGAMLVDVVSTDAWAGPRPLVRTRIADLLYTRDGINMMHLPVKKSNWPSAMRSLHAKVDEASRETVDIKPQSKSRSKVDLFGKPGRTMDRMMDRRSGYGEFGPDGGRFMDPRGGYR